MSALDSLADNETDSDDGMPRTAAAMAGSSSAVAMSPDGIKGSASSPLSLLKSHVEALRHFPSSESTGGRALEAENDPEDYAAVARRAEVRRIAHKLIREELQSEKPPPVTQAYRRVAMSTIKEDPSDAASSCGGPSRDVENNRTPRVNQDKAVASTAFDKRHKSHKSCIRDQKADRSSEEPEAAKLLQPFQVKPPATASLPRGLRIRSRIRGAVGEKRWGRATLVTTESQQSSEVATLDDESSTLPLQTLSSNSGTTHIGEKRLSAGCGGFFMALAGGGIPSEDTCTYAATPSSHRTESPAPTHPESDQAPDQVNSLSESLGSVDDNASIHEAHEARIFTANKASNSVPCLVAQSANGQQSVPSADHGPSASCLLCIMAVAHLQHANHKSDESVASHLGTVVGRDVFDKSENDGHGSSSTNLSLGKNDGQTYGIAGKRLSQTLPNRRGVGGPPLQFRSLTQLDLVGSEINDRSSRSSGHIRGRSLDVQHFPESWWKPTPIPHAVTQPECVEPNEPAALHTEKPLPKTPVRADTPVASETSDSEQSGLLLFSARAVPASIRTVLKMGINKLMLRGQNTNASSVQMAPSTNADHQQDGNAGDSAGLPKLPKLPKLPVLSELSLANIESLDQMLADGPFVPGDTEGPVSGQRLSVNCFGSCSPSPSQEDIISDIDSVFGVLIRVDDAQEPAQEPPTPRIKELSALLDTTWPPLTAPSTPVSNAYAEVHAYIITNFPEKPFTEQARTTPATPVLGGTFDFEKSSNQHGDEPSRHMEPIFKSNVEKEDAVSVKSGSAPTRKHNCFPSSPRKYMTWNGPSRVNAPMRSTLEFGLEMDQVLHGTTESIELFSSREYSPSSMLLDQA